MKRLLVLPVIATLLMATAASAQTPPGPAAQDNGAACGHMGHHKGAGMWRHDNPLAALPKPLTADSVKQALEAQFAKRPHVGTITEKDPNTLIVEIVSADGNTIHKVAIDRATGARRPNR